MNSLIQKGKIVLAVVLAGFVFASCNDDDGYSIGDFMIDFGVIQKTGSTSDDNSFEILLDSGDKAIPLATDVPWFKTHDNQRVMVSVNPLDDKVNEDGSKTYYVKILDMKNIRYKNISKLGEVSLDSMGSDPIIVRDTWITADSILNVDFKFYTEGSTHYLNLLDINEGDGIATPKIFELRHNARGDDERYPVYGYASFKLNPIKNPAQSQIKFNIRYTDYDGKIIEVPYTLDY